MTEDSQRIVAGTAVADEFLQQQEPGTQYVGGKGDDTYHLGAGQSAVEAASSGTDTIVTGESTTLPENVENLRLTSGAAGTGNAQDNILEGSAGDDTLDGGAGNDVLKGDGGCNLFVVTAGEGSDRIVGFDPAVDSLEIRGTWLASREQMVQRAAQVGDDVLVELGQGEVLTLAGLTLEALAAATSVSFRASAPEPQVATTSAAASLPASRITGTDFSDVMLPAPGQAVFMAGGLGDDTYHVTHPAHTVYERGASGIDTVLTTVDIDLPLNIENARAVSPEVAVLRGNPSRNVLTGTDGAQTIDGGRGRDILTGGAGADVFVIRSGEGPDVITDFSGDVLKFVDLAFTERAQVLAAATPTRTGGVVIALGDGFTLTLEKMTVAQLAAAEMWFEPAVVTPPPAAPMTLTGTAAAETLTGDTGNDTLSGLGGRDTLTGLAGADLFVLTLGEAADDITDFDGAAGDRIELRNFGFRDGAEVLAQAEQVGADTRIWLTANDFLTLRGVSLAGLKAEHFVIAGAPVRVEGTAGNDTFWQDNKAVQTYAGGTGNDTYFVKNTRAKIEELPGGGTDTIVTWMNYALPPEIEVGVVGNSAGASALSLRGNALNNVLRGDGTGRHQIDGGAGDDTLTGGAGADLFLVTAGEGSDVITDFTAGPGGDVLRLAGFGFRSFLEVMAATRQEGTDTILTLSADQTLTLRGVDRTTLVAANVAAFVPSTDGMNLLFAEEFDRLDLRSTSNPNGVWRPVFYYEAGRTLPSNGERQIYLDPDYKGLGLNPFSISEDGVATIRVSETPEALRPQLDNMPFMSGLLTSEQSFSVQYGYFEMRAKLPRGAGLWPAWWLLPIDGQWPPEIDIFEVLSVNSNVLHTTVHTKDTGAHTASGQGTLIADTASGMHLYGFAWGPEEMIWYFDGVEVFRAPTPEDCKKPMYMLANVAVGGWGGLTQRDTLSSPDNTDMQIDYVRAWQRPADAAPAPLPTDAHPVTFSDMDGTGAVLKWASKNVMADGEVKAKLASLWTRWLTGNSLDNYLEGSACQYNELDGRGGNDVLKGGLGVDNFVIRRGEGNDTILDLSGDDKVHLVGFHFAHFDDVIAWSVQAGDDVLIRLARDQMLRLKNTRIEALKPNNFYFTGIVPLAPTE